MTTAAIRFGFHCQVLFAASWFAFNHSYKFYRTGKSFDLEPRDKTDLVLSR
jgi:hypothetical protein